MPEFRPPAMFSSPTGGPAPGYVGPESKLSQDFVGPMNFVGGSMPEEGKSPFDEPQYYDYGQPNVSKLMGLPTYGQGGNAPPAATGG